MGRLMRRSVVVHEFRDRVLWDEDADADGEAEERVRVVGLGGGVGEEEGEVVGEWLEGGGY